MAEDILHSERTADGGNRTVWQSVTADGGIFIAGQDLGDLSGFFGGGVREYEWAHLVAAEQVPKLVRELGGSGDDDVRELMRMRFSGVRHGEFAGFCKEHGIEVKFWSRFGE